MGTPCLKIIKTITKKWEKSNQKSTEILEELRTLGIRIKHVTKEGHNTVRVMNLNVFEFA